MYSETCLTPSSGWFGTLWKAHEERENQIPAVRGGETDREPRLEAGFSNCQRGKDITEEIVGSLVGVSGHTFDLEYDLFFTTERVIAVIIQHPTDIPCQFTPTWKSMFLGSGWEKREEQREQEKIAQARRRTSQNLTPDELVTTHSGNIEIWNSKITSVEIARRLFQSQLRFYVPAPPTTGQIIHFNLSKKQIPEAHRLLEQVLLTKIKEK